VQYRFQLQLLLHGTIMMLIGLLAGLPLMLAIDLGWGDASVHSWAVAHTSVTLTGVAFIAISAAFDHLVHGALEAAILVRSLLLCAYTFTIGLMVVGIAGVRGLAPMGPALNWVAFILFVIGAFAVVFGVATMILGAFRALRTMSPRGDSETST
jgi:hypothetical protein